MNKSSPSLSNGNRPLITTTFAAIGSLIVILTAVVTVEGWLYSSRFTTVVDSRFDRFELRMNEKFASSKDTLPRTEYELRHAEALESVKRVADRIDEAGRRIDLTLVRIQALENRQNRK